MKHYTAFKEIIINAISISELLAIKHEVESSGLSNDESDKLIQLIENQIENLE